MKGRIPFSVIMALGIMFSISVHADFDALTVGSSGEQVKQVQSKWKDLGYLDGTADGIFVEGTENAVIVYQAKNGLEATGIVDEEMYQSLLGDGTIGSRRPGAEREVRMRRVQRIS